MDPTTLHALLQVAILANRLIPLLHAGGSVSDEQLAAVARAGRDSDRAYDAYHRELRGLPDTPVDAHLRPELARAAARLAERLSDPRPATDPH